MCQWLTIARIKNLDNTLPIFDIMYLHMIFQCFAYFSMKTRKQFKLLNPNK